MIGAGLDLGASQVKGVVIEISQDGTLILREAVMIGSAEFSSGGEIIAALGRRRKSPFSKLPLVISASNAETLFGRMRVTLPQDAGHVTEEILREWLFAGKMQPPAGTDLKGDYWDMKIQSLFRRSTDVEQNGEKSADVIFARVPRALAERELPKDKNVVVAGMQPSGIGLLDAYLKLAPAADNESTSLILDMGVRQVRGFLVRNREIVASTTAAIEDLENQVARAARAGQRIATMDVMGSDPASGTIRAAVTRALQAVIESLWAHDESRKPHRAVICGGLAGLRSMPRLVNAALGVPAEPIPQPDRARPGLVLPAAFSAFAAATGAALRAAGASRVELAPRRQTAPSMEKAAKRRPITAAGLGERLKDWASGTGQMIRSAMAGIRTLPERLGWGWVAIGAFALAASIPTAWFYSKSTGALAELDREYRELLPGVTELKREADLLDRYARLSGTATLSYFPWGDVVAEIVARMPDNVFISSLNADADRVLITGRARGSLEKILSDVSRRLKDSPVLKRHGLTPPEL